MSDAPSSVEGWLFKKGGGTSFFGRRNWTKQYFKVEGDVVRYYSSKSSKQPNVSYDSPQGNARSSIPCPNVLFYRVDSV